MAFFACIGYNSYILSKSVNYNLSTDPDRFAKPAKPAKPKGPIDTGANSHTIQMYVTSYGFNDNDNGAGQFSTSVIAYPKKEGNPTHHDVTTEGAGTYDDPITFAAGIKAIKGGTFPVGSILYVLFLQKYFMLEDQCAECDKDLNGAKYHIDLYMGPSDHPSSQGPLYDCEGKITRNTDVVLKPASNLPVDTNPLFQNNQCTAHIH